MVVPAALLTATPAAAVMPIGLVSFTSWTETLAPDLTAVHIVGQVRNNTAGNVTLVRVNISLADTANDTTWTYATLDILGPNEYSPFELNLFPAPPGYAGYTIGAISYAPAVSQPYHSQLAATIDPCPAGSAADWVCGSVTNNGTVTVDGVKAVITNLDASNTTIAQERSPLVENASGGTTLATNETGHFTFELNPGEPVGTTRLVVAEPDYPADLNPVPLDVGRVNVGKTGQQDVTLFNTGLLPITVSVVQATPSPEFTASTDCPSTGLGAGLSCHVTVHFTPASRGARSGTLTITDDAAGSPQTVALTGTGTAPQVTFVPASTLDFGSTVRAGTIGTLKTVTLINSGDGPLTITSMTSDDPADLKVDGSACATAPYTIAPGGQCLIIVTFTPTIAGPYGMNVPHTNLAAANLVVVDDAGTQKLPLQGMAIGPGAQLTVGDIVIAGVDFGQQAVKYPSPPADVTVTNNGTESLVIGKIVLTGDFTESDTCALPIAAGGSCTVSITFTPSQLGKETGGMTITDNAANGQQSITLTGVGINVSGRRQGSGIHRELLTGPIVAIPIQN